MDLKFYSLEEVAELFGVNYQSEPQLKGYMDIQSTGAPASGGAVRSAAGAADAISVNSHWSGNAGSAMHLQESVREWSVS